MAPHSRRRQKHDRDKSKGEEKSFFLFFVFLALSSASLLHRLISHNLLKFSEAHIAYALCLSKARQLECSR